MVSVPAPPLSKELETAQTLIKMHNEDVSTMSAEPQMDPLQTFKVPVYQKVQMPWIRLLVIWMCVYQLY